MNTRVSFSSHVHWDKWFDNPWIIASRHALRLVDAFIENGRYYYTVEGDACNIALMFWQLGAEKIPVRGEPIMSYEEK